MGLDMYLSAKIHAAGYDFYSQEKQEQYRALVEASGLGDVADPSTPSADVEVTVGYWRKANAIHRWFVDNVQEGEDNCRSYEVSREQLAELRDTCRKVLEVAQIADGQPVFDGTTYYTDDDGNPQVKHTFVQARAALNGADLAEILPTQAGFFFGGTEYDEWYIQDVERTIAMLDKVLEKTPEEAYFTYSSSW